MSDEMRPADLNRILAYEELNDAERLEIDRRLAANPTLAARIDQIRSIEQRAVRPVPVAADDGFWADQDLSGEAETAWRDSFHRVRAAISGSSAAPADGTARRRSWRWLLPVAAVLALVVILPLRARRDTLLTWLTVETIAAMPDGTRSASPAPLTDGRLRGGEAFVLAFELKADSYVVVAHVDPRGRVVLVYPADQSQVAMLAGGRRHQLPDPENDEIWILSGTTGLESFIVATDRESEPSLAALQASLASSAGGHDRSSIVRSVRETLAATWDQVEVIEFLHVE